jgi:hypothetical protein
MKLSLPPEIIQAMPSYHGRVRSSPRAAAQDSARIQGGNWSMQGLRRSGHVYDEGECRMSIDEFMAGHGQSHDSDDA